MRNSKCAFLQLGSKHFTTTTYILVMGWLYSGWVKPHILATPEIWVFKFLNQLFCDLFSNQNISIEHNFFKSGWMALKFPEKNGQNKIHFPNLGIPRVQPFRVYPPSLIHTCSLNCIASLHFLSCCSFYQISSSFCCLQISILL